MTLGSASARADVVLDGQGVAEVHCAIGRAKSGGWAIKDLGSDFGTLVNGERVTQRKLEPGESKLFPATLEAAKETRVNLLVCISRALSTEAGDTCTFTVLSADVAGLNHHRAQARPPKMRFRTALELRRVPMSRVLDGAFWSFLYTTMTLPWKERARKSPLALFYEVLLSFVCNSSLGVAMAASEAERRAERLATIKEELRTVTEQCTLMDQMVHDKMRKPTGAEAYRNRQELARLLEKREKVEKTLEAEQAEHMRLLAEIYQ
jgi:hypothetical protein